MNSLIVLAACVVTSQTFLFNMDMNPREALKSVRRGVNQGTSEYFRCLRVATDMCPDLSQVGFITGTHNNGLHQLSCTQTTIDRTRECLARARVGCEDYSNFADGLMSTWELMCDHQQEMIENADCLGLPYLQSQWSSCIASFTTPLQGCQEYASCIRSVILGLQPVCSNEAANLMYTFVQNMNDVAFGANCERLPN